MRNLLLFIVTALSVMIAGCSPEVGSKAWCKQMADKPAGEWTPKEAVAFAESCDATLLMKK